LPDFSRSLLDFFQIVDSQFIVLVLHNYIDLVVSENELRTVGWAIAQGEKSREFRVATVGCVAC